MTQKGDHTYKQRRALVKARWAAEQRACHLCHGAKGPIDYDAPAGAPLAFDLDHIIPTSQGGAVMAMSNWAASHATCNRSRKAQDLEAFRQQQAARQPAPTRRTTSW